ncbi:PstC family ABC transporter permease [Caldinitratiruptor microaerophilus]|uniref:Phosphate transport system permease protein n=1 Tax=Caldinitratiruptor microaerophilus TaxID=671077 RepID=A0AA35G9L5_9FIRM|nr:ABC transporter permease subunit [Caldinitratiruptor microaerophilus]BDG61593.1 phosphate transport system permease protein [Caldinitratiruptor microaerophilus]
MRAERAAELAVRACGWLGAFLLLLVPAYLLSESAGFLRAVGLREFLLGTAWAPRAPVARFGVLPLLAGTLLTTGVAMAVALPVGTLAALYLSEGPPGPLKGAGHVALRTAAALPPVVIGLMGRTYVAPALAAFLGLPDGHTALAAGLCLAAVVLPTYTLLAAGVLREVPQALREAAASLGATPWEVAVRAVLPAGAPGLRAVAALAAARAAGETMVVLMVAGSRPDAPGLLRGVEPLSAAIAWEMGEAPAGSLHRQSLFALGLVLLAIGLLLHAAAGRWWLRREGA